MPSTGSGRDRSLPVPTGGAIPPQAKPARSRHQPPAPTGTAGQSNSSMGPTPPRSTHGRPSRPSAPSPRGAGDRERTDYGCRCRCAPSPARGSTDQPGSTTAWVAVSSQEPPTGRESTRTPGPSAANTPQVLLRSAVCASRFANDRSLAASASASARMASASVCASTTRAAVRSPTARAASARQRSAIRPLPGVGSHPPISTASANARSDRPSTRWADSAIRRASTGSAPSAPGHGRCRKWARHGQEVKESGGALDRHAGPAADRDERRIPHPPGSLGSSPPRGGGAAGGRGDAGADGRTPFWPVPTAVGPLYRSYRRYGRPRVQPVSTACGHRPARSLS